QRRPAPAAAPPPALAARVRRLAGADSVPVPGTPVRLHRIGAAAQGIVDSARTDSAGAATLAATPDTAALFLLSSRWGGIEYFSTPFRLRPGAPAPAAEVVVYDTSSSTSVQLVQRHLVVEAPGADGARLVREVLMLRNAGDRTRVAPDSLGGSWWLLLPRGATDVQPGTPDLPPTLFAHRGDTVLVLAPIVPGERELSVAYTLPALAVPRLEVPLVPAPLAVDVLLAEAAATVQAPFAIADSQAFDGRTFRRWAAPGQAERLVLAFDGGGWRPPRATAPLLAGAFGVLFALLLPLLVRRRRAR
ncbi:MAG: hypothetical protein NW201_05205, partial [Gemmatimonadales bacterium]|nr:hypothetical protein [Gemmatimonadales bacterium]